MMVVSFLFYSETVNHTLNCCTSLHILQYLSIDLIDVLLNLHHRTRESTEYMYVVLTHMGKAKININLSMV